jgi:hypothetical protein
LRPFSAAAKAPTDEAGQLQPAPQGDRQPGAELAVKLVARLRRVPQELVAVPSFDFCTSSQAFQDRHVAVPIRLADVLKHEGPFILAALGARRADEIVRSAFQWSSSSTRRSGTT